MSVPTVIPRQPADPDLAYDTLRAAALQFIETTASDSWSDVNEHDPGVTTLELLCYAVTELGYRAGFPVADLLAGPHGTIDMRRQALHTPRRILPSAPVTLNDYRKLLMDRVPGLANVWLVPVETQQAVTGLYDIDLHASDLESCRCEGAPADPRLAQVLGVFVRHRALCEDVRHVRLLQPVRTTLSATADIAGHDEPESIAADLLYRAGQFLAPEIRRRPLANRLAAGLTTSQIFDGPLLRNGFIDDADLQPRSSRIDMTRLIRAMAESPGVSGISDLTLRIGRQTYGATDVVPVGNADILRLDPSLDARTPPIRLIRHGHPCRLDANRVRQELAKRWRSHRRLHPLARDYHQAFAPPRGRRHDLAHYASIRGLYPETYGIGARGLPADASPLRQAQARQLKGYLLVFEQLLADYLAQLAHARDLLSTIPTLTHTYAGQSLATALPDLADLLPTAEAIDHLRTRHDAGLPRRSRFLDVLLALYAADPPTHELATEQTREQRDDSQVAAKLRTLNSVARASRDRGLGIDYLAEASVRNQAGLARGIPHLHGEPHTLHVIEHVLLRPARRLRGDATTPPPFDYAFTVSVVMHFPGTARADDDMRAHFVALLRARTPAHIALRVHQLTASEMQSFTPRHTAWRTALRSRDPWAIVRSCVRLRDALVKLPTGDVNAGAATTEGGGRS
ncbi:hypothetical protein [Bradyrhizobium sp. 2TAF24]|uniref:hypothetical protein n=1 Tax=Bradyrhizobium sp. 2TAF24 TaxID=3233011 RepID=UPI003F8DE175